MKFYTKIIRAVVQRRTGAFLSLMPRHQASIYQWCRNYVDQFNGDNNGDFHTNGELYFLQRQLGQLHTVFDVGANIGEWSSGMLAMNPDVKLHCFEPSPATFQRLLANHFPANVICNNVGLSSSAGESILHIFEDGSGMNSMYQREGLEVYNIKPQQLTETIHLETLDNYCLKNKIETIDFLKVDVEGHELEVFKGALQMIAQYKIKAIQFEYGGCNIDSHTMLKDLFDLFRPYDYGFFKLYPTELRAVERYDQRLENYQYQNWGILNRHPS